MIEACLFDLDGTILDTLKTIAYYGNEALIHFGFEPIEESIYKKLVGNGAKTLISRMLKLKGTEDEKIKKDVFRYYDGIYKENPTYLTEPFDGICELLSSLKERGIKIGVISNKQDYLTKFVCEKLFWGGLLDCVQGQIDGIKIKPDPEGPKMVLEKLGVKGSCVAYIGDSDVDMQTGKNLSAYTIGVLWGLREEDELIENGAQFIAKTPEDILNEIDRLNTK